jgi:RNA polymerase sigma factor (TIGR02999 family)
MSDVTRILQAIDEGQADAAEALLPLVYDELRRLAAQRLARETPGQTLQATALVHEAFLRLVGTEDSPQRFQSRGHFFAAAAEAMRRILVENARRKHRLKRGGDQQRLELLDDQLAESAAPDQLLAVHEALDRLAAEDPLAAEIVKLRYFAGLSIDQAADALAMSRATAYRHWTYARAWLKCALRPDAP